MVEPSCAPPAQVSGVPSSACPQGRVWEVPSSAVPFILLSFLVSASLFFDVSHLTIACVLGIFHLPLNYHTLLIES